MTFHAPAASRPRSVAGHEQPLVDHALGPDDGAQVLLVVEHDRGRQLAAGQQPAGAVQVGEDGVEQLGALDHAGLERGPLAVVQHQRQRVEPPRPGLLERRRGRRGSALGGSTIERADAGLGV